MSSFNQTDRDCVNSIRVLSADVVQQANSGHPGMPMGMAPIAHVLWDRVMKFAPTKPKWAGRDRFVLSNGHGCALLYSMLHLTGYDLSMDELKRFRQVDSKTPGHPESFVTAGCEVTTGPLGQGIANAVGMAYAEAHMAAVFNKPGFELFDNFTYVFCGDGCLQEGMSSEASSLAGHWGLGKLIVMYDDNKITIDGETNLSFTEDVLMRYRAYGWHTLTVEKGDLNLDGILAAIELAKSVTDRPSIISIKTTIGFGAAKEGKEEVHGAPLGAKDLAAVKTKFGLDPSKSFHVKAEVTKQYSRHAHKGTELVGAWDALYEKYCQQFPDQGADLARRLAGDLPKGWENHLPTYTAKDKGDATRNLSGKALNAIANVVPEFVGGSADLTPSNKTALKVATDFQKGNHGGRYLRFGVREHGMAAIANGIAAYGGFIPFTATFLNFIQYCFPAVRLAALSGHRQIFVMTHDSIGLGEDGPTHQPVEAVAMCRATPNLYTFRPADGNEVSGAYKHAMTHHGPSVLCLSRQNMPSLQLSSIENTLKGAYVVLPASKPDLVLVATGSEVGLCLEVAKAFEGRVQVVSMPCMKLFDEQTVAYRRSVIPPHVPTVAVECLGTFGWEKYSHYCIGMTTFGASAPIDALMTKFGFTVPLVLASLTKFLHGAKADLAAMGGGCPAGGGGATLGPLPTHYAHAAVLRAHL